MISLLGANITTGYVPCSCAPPATVGCRVVADVDHLCADPSKAVKQLGWEPKIGFDELITMMVESDLALLGRSGTYDDDPFGPDTW